MEITERVVEVKYAGFWIRLVAYLIDAAILAVINWVLLAVLIQMVGGSLSVQSVLSPSWPLLAATALSSAVWLGNVVLLPPVLGGTLGKVVLGLHIVDRDHRHISFLRALGRALAAILSALVLFLGFVAIGLSTQKRGLHDQLAGTYVVRKEFALPRPFQRRELAVALVAILLLTGVQVGLTGALTGVLGQNLGPAVEVSNEFLGALQREDYEAAFTYCHPGLQEDLENPQNLRSIFSGVGLEQWTITQANLRTQLMAGTAGMRVVDVAGAAQFSDNQELSMQLVLLDEGSGWTVAGFQFE